MKENEAFLMGRLPFDTYTYSYEVAFRNNSGRVLRCLSDARLIHFIIFIIICYFAICGQIITGCDLPSCCTSVHNLSFVQSCIKLAYMRTTPLFLRYTLVVTPLQIPKDA